MNKKADDVKEETPEEKKARLRAQKIANLKPLVAGSKRAKEVASKGGKRSAEVQRQKRNFRDTMKSLLFTELSGDNKKLLKKFGITQANLDNATMMDLAGAKCLARIIKDGDIGALGKLAEMAGEFSPENKLTVEGGLKAESARPVINLHLGERPKQDEAKED